MTFDIKRWLTEEMGFSADDAAAMAPKFSPDKVEATYVSPAERKRLTDQEAAIAKTQAELKAANEALNVEMAEWATLTAKEKEAATELQKSLEAARVRTTQLETRLTNLATEHGVDPKALLEGTVVIPEKKVVEIPPIDTSKFVSTDVFGNVAAYNMDLAGTIPYILQQHKALTGEDLDPRTIVSEIKTRAGKKDAVIDPIAIWEEKYGIPAKREAKAKEQRDAEDKAAEARGYERAMTERATPGPSIPGRHAPVFGRPSENGLVPRTSVLKRPQPEAGVRSAAAALASHKYRTKTA